MTTWQDHINPEGLMAWMDRQGLEHGPILEGELFAGGTQNLILRFKRGNSSFVLRRPPVHLRKNSNETMLREARVLAALADTTVPHPRMIASCSDEDVIGSAFYLMESVDGFNPAVTLPDFHKSDPKIRHRMGLAFVEAIAALGNLDYKAIGLERFGKPDGFLERQVPRWLAQLESYKAFENWPGTGSIPGVDRIARWLDDHRPADFTPGILHGDYHFGNVLFCKDSAELAAVVDWELSTIGAPLLDLGWILATWPDENDTAPPIIPVCPWQGFPSAAELVEHYETSTSQSVDDITWYAALACFKLGLILEGTYARACAGKAPLETGQKLHNQSVQLFQRAIRLVA